MIYNSMRIENISVPHLAPFFHANNIVLSETQLNQFNEYFKLITFFKQSTNITGFKKSDDIINNLFIDSLVAIKNVCFPPHPLVCDIGSGAGIPGIPIKIVYPNINLTIIEAVEKKCFFIKNVIKQLNLATVEVVWDRAENIGKNSHYRERFDFCVAKAVAQLNILLELSLPLLKINGKLFAYKGIKASEEINKSEKALSLLGGSIKDSVPYTIYGMEKKFILVVVKKIKKTSLEYPRKPGIPEKKPL